MPDIHETARPASAGRTADQPLLAAERLTKLFPGVRALAEADFHVAADEIVALLGQNGAGKSTLIQILAGAHPAGSYSGAIAFDGRRYSPASIAEAEAAGIVLVPQEINVVPDLTVAQNMTLFVEPTRFGIIDVARQLQVARQALANFDLDIDPAAPMASLDLATQQLVVIARAIAKRARLLILDEPTAALTENESGRLFDRLRALKSRGVSIIFVTHRLAEIFAIADRIVVMRDGKVRGSHRATDISRPQVVTEMIGHMMPESARRVPTASADLALQVHDLSLSDAEGRVRLSRFNLALRRGEIVGLFGLLGAGCIEVAQAIYGAYAGRRKGRILVDGAEADIASPQDAVAQGLGLMAQDRRDCLIGDHSINDNVNMASLARIVRGGSLDVALGRRRARDQAEALDIKASSIEVEVRTLSGGNQQKVQIARWLAADARVLIMIDPTRGVDVGARRDIKRIWLELAHRDRALLIASSDAEELADVCDRVVVLNRGRQVGELAGDDLTEANLVRMATDG